MRKALLWGGLVIFVVFLAIGFLAGATNGPDLKPIWPLVYGSNQTLWAFLALVGLVLFVVGLIMVIVRAIRNRNTRV